MLINIDIVKKRPTVNGTPVIVCGNSCYRIQFTFDEEWADLEYKIARFVFQRDGQPHYIDVPFAGDTVEVPTFCEIAFVYVGVYTDLMQTTTPAKIPCEYSIRCNSGERLEVETPEIYEKLMALYNQVAADAGRASEAAQAADQAKAEAQEAATEATQANANAHEAAEVAMEVCAMFGDAVDIAAGAKGVLLQEPYTDELLEFDYFVASRSYPVKNLVFNTIFRGGGMLQARCLDVDVSTSGSEGSTYELSYYDLLFTKDNETGAWDMGISHIDKTGSVDSTALWAKVVGYKYIYGTGEPEIGERPGVVLYEAQALNEDEMAQARENIGASNVGLMQETSGEIFNNYERNKASMRGHAANDCTEAGWRSSTEGYYSYADDTSHAGGRLTRSTGVAAFAHGLELAEKLHINGSDLVTTQELTMHSIEIPVNVPVTGVIEVGDFVCLLFSSTQSTDCRKVAAISEDGLSITLDYPYYEPLQPAYENYGIDQETLVFPVGTVVRLADLCEATGNGSVAAGCATKATGDRAVATGQKTKATGSYSRAGGIGCEAGGECAVAEGRNNKARGTYSVALGTNNEVSAAGAAAIGEGNKATSARAIALGMGNNATGANALATGQNTTASGNYSKTGGSQTVASGSYSMADGFKCTASGTTSSAKGNQTTAAGDQADASGNRTIANGYCQSVRGRRNIPDPSVNGYTYLEIVGNSKGEGNSNAYTLDWDGNAWFAGSVEGSALILRSPNGSRFQITVGNDGQLKTTKI